MMRTKKKVWITVLCMLMLTAMLPLQVFAASKKASIKLDSKEKTITVGSSAMLTATVTGKSSKVTWKSSNPKVAAVSKGKITAKKAGKVTITAKANGKTAKCTVTVKAVDYKRLYKKFLEKKSVKADNYSTTPDYFYVLNIDQKGVPELIITQYTPGGAIYCVYTIVKNKVTYTGSCYTKQKPSSVFTYNKKKKGIYIGNWSQHGIYECLYGMNSSGKKLVCKQHAAWNYLPKIEYRCGEKESQDRNVTKKKYNTFRNKYFSKNDLKDITMYANTSSNRSKVFK